MRFRHRDLEKPLRRHLLHRTERLTAASKTLHYVSHYSAQPFVVAVVTALLAIIFAVGVLTDFARLWIDAVSLGLSVITLVLVFIIQHAQATENLATQRKLDEIIKAIPEASDDLILLEEAPPEVLLEVEDLHREVKSESMGDSSPSRT